VPEHLRQLYTTGKLGLPGKGPRDESPEQQTTLSRLPVTSEQPSAPAIGRPTTVMSPVSPRRLIALLPISLFFFFAIFYLCRNLSKELSLTSRKVLEYLSKKGYKRTEATLRKESEEHDPVTGYATSSKKPDDAEVMHKAYGMSNDAAPAIRPTR